MGGRKFKLSVPRESYDDKNHALQSNKTNSSECSSLAMNDKLRRLLERVSAAIPTGWLMSDECSGLVLVKLTM